MDEAVKLLSQYIAINTTNPPGNEIEGAKFFAEIFEGEGIEYKIYEPEPKRASIRAVIPGSGEKEPLILMHHMDVVPADKTEWSFEPFSGKVKDGYILGRGALDTKGLGIMELIAFLAIKRNSITPNRDLIFLAEADEEMAGNIGMAYLLENHPDDFKAGLVINEGGFSIEGLLPENPLFLVATAEKGVCWLELTASGAPGHASTPHCNNALEKLNRALTRLLDTEIPFEVKPNVAKYFEGLARGWPFLKPYVEDPRPEVLIETLKETGLLDNPVFAAQLKNTVCLTVMTSGDKTNIIPSSAKAHLDCRILPGVELDDFVDTIRERMGDDAEIEIKFLDTSTANISPDDTEEYRVIEGVIKKHWLNAVVTPYMLTGGSDSRFFRDRGVNCYGILPGLFRLEDVDTIHGIDEKISVDNLLVGTEVMTDIVKLLCT